MPLVNDTPSTPPVEVPTPVHITKPSYRGVAVDTKYTPAKSLLTHVEGSSWTVNYYSQVLDSDTALSGQNQDRSAVYQQYRLIQRFEMKVTSPLTQSQDQGTGNMTLTGQANLYPSGVIPNNGDMFVADIGDGRQGVFRITSSEQRSIYKDTAYIVDYTLLDYMDAERQADFDSKTVEWLTFVLDFLTTGQNPLVVTSDYIILDKLQRAYTETAREYLRRFVSNEYRTLIMPGQKHSVYDPFLTRAVLKAFDSDDGIQLQKIRELNIGEDDNMFSTTIWDALLSKKRSRLKLAIRKVGLVNSVLFTRDAMMESIRYSGVKFVVYPIDPERSEDDIRSGAHKTISDSNFITPTPNRLTRLLDMITVTELNGFPAMDVTAVNPMTESSYYVLSQAFYERSPVGQSALELCVQNYLDDRAINLPTLLRLAENYTAWPLLEQFYQVPILLMMIRAAIRRM